jgi:hypothetical protein
LYAQFQEFVASCLTAQKDVRKLTQMPTMIAAFAPRSTSTFAVCVLRRETGQGAPEANEDTERSGVPQRPLEASDACEVHNGSGRPPEPAWMPSEPVKNQSESQRPRLLRQKARNEGWLPDRDHDRCRSGNCACSSSVHADDLVLPGRCLLAGATVVGATGASDLVPREGESLRPPGIENARCANRCRASGGGEARRTPEHTARSSFNIDLGTAVSRSLERAGCVVVLIGQVHLDCLTRCIRALVCGDGRRKIGPLAQWRKGARG